MSVAKIVDQYVDVFSSSFPTTSFELGAFDKTLDRLHVYSNFDHWVKENIFEWWLRASDDGCCFYHGHCVDVYAIPP